jgi:LmbE family N-acetylglucosaminyl deacetylase
MNTSNYSIPCDDCVDMQDRSNVLVIAPHPDDESIGCGGALCLHAARGNRTVVVFLTSGERGLKHLPCDEARRIREREAEAAVAVLGVSEWRFLRLRDCHVGESVQQAAGALRPILEREVPQRIYLPHVRDQHPDHQASLHVVSAALEECSIPLPSLLCYEVWTPLAEYDDGADISSVMRQKMQAVRCHRSQVEQLRYDRGVRGLNQYRGALAWGCRYAEVFQHVAAAGTPISTAEEMR